MKASNFFSGLVSAIRLLTIIPCPGPEPERTAAVQPWFPVVGLLVGLIAAGLAKAAWTVAAGWNEAAGFVAVSALACLTGGIHLDGLCDWADGFWGGHTREKTLIIMKDSRIGAFGAGALVIVLLGKWVALSRLAGLGEWLWIAAACAMSRVAPVLLAASQPYARPEGGMGEDFVKNTSLQHAVMAAAAAAAMTAVMLRLTPDWAVVFAAVLGFAALFGVWCRRRVGGVTGDLLGASVELSELLALLLAASLAARH